MNARVVIREGLRHAVLIAGAIVMAAGSAQTV